MAKATGRGEFYDFVVTYEDPALLPYEHRSIDRLDFILNQLDLGSDANLGYTKVTWLPDQFVRIRYLAMEGILQPIIVVRVEFQPGVTAEDFKFRSTVEFEEEEDQPPTPPPSEPRYIPYAWIGISAFNHALSGGAEGNVNADFWGYPVDPHLVGFEPTIGGIGIIRDFPSSVESAGGALVIGTSWAERAGHRALDQQFYVVNDGQDWQMNEFGIEQGTFQDSDWDLSTRGWIAASRTNMLALEHLDTFVTAPAAAFGSGFDELPSNYWKRSIIIPGELGVLFPDGPKSDVIDIGGGAQAAVSATYGGGGIQGQVLSGRYEIGAFTRNFHCEATTAQVHIRVVLGGVLDDGLGSSVTVIDFFPSGIGQPCGNNRQNYVRVTALGGNPPCDLNGDNSDNVFGPNDGGAGWWDKSIYINVQNNSISVETASRDAPFFGGGCGTARHHSCDDPVCTGGCVGDPVAPPAHNLDYPLGFTVSFDKANEVNPGVIDLRGGVLWHMARVTQVDNITGQICFVQLQGNDGAQGGTCAGCQAFSYGHTLRANGYHGLKELGTDLRQLEQGRFNVGELVTVIGWTDVHDAPCLAAPGGWRLIVTDPHGAGQDFTSLYWYDLRCPPIPPGRNAVSQYFEGVEFAYRNRALCQGGPVGVDCGCHGGQWRCL
jgi:hypothetical protein